MKVLLKLIAKQLQKTKIPYLLFEYLRKSYYKTIYDNYKRKYNISDDFLFNGIDIEMYGDGEIIIKSGSYIGNRSVVSAYKGCKVEIGRNCSISHNVRIYTNNRMAIDIISGDNEIGYRKGDVKIGDNCWIGANVFITEGVTIGNNVVIGANAVVTNDIPSGSIAGGVPAKVIRSNIR